MAPSSPIYVLLSLGIAFVPALTNSTATTISINDNKYPAVIKLDVNKAVEIADAILNSIGELNSDEFNDKIYELENKIEELEAALQDREDRIDYMRRHETYMPF